MHATNRFLLLCALVLASSLVFVLPAKETAAMAKDRVLFVLTNHGQMG